MRLQVLMLPSPGDETPWALVIDDIENLTKEQASEVGRVLDKKAIDLGGRGALVFSEKVEVL